MAIQTSSAFLLGFHGSAFRCFFFAVLTCNVHEFGENNALKTCIHATRLTYDQQQVLDRESTSIKDAEEVKLLAPLPIKHPNMEATSLEGVETAHLPESSPSKYQWLLATQWGPHRALLKTFIDAALRDTISCMSCPILPPTTLEHEVQTAMLATLNKCQATCFQIPSDFDITKSTKEAYTDKHVKVAVSDQTHFKEERRLLNVSYHGHYFGPRQMWQNIWMSRVANRVGKAKDGGPWAIFTAGAMGVGKGYVMNWTVNNGYFALEHIAHVDPDYFKSIMPEWLHYVEYQEKHQNDKTSEIKSAGTQCHLESGMMVELVSAKCLQQHHNFWEDGSLRNGAWYRDHVFPNIKASAGEGEPAHRIALFHIKPKDGDLQQILNQVEQRAIETGRTVNTTLVKASFEASSHAVTLLKDEVDLFVEIQNVRGSDPVLTHLKSKGQPKVEDPNWSHVEAHFGPAELRPDEAWGGTFSRSEWVKLTHVHEARLADLSEATFIKLFEMLRLDLKDYPLALKRVYASFKELPNIITEEGLGEWMQAEGIEWDTQQPFQVRNQVKYIPTPS